MSNSKEITRLRKEGHLEEAYALAQADIAAPGADEWAVRALSWCLVALIKRAADRRNQAELSRFAAELESLPPPVGDEILEPQRRFALSLAEKGRHEILAARAHSKAGRFAEASRIYQGLLDRGALYPADHPGFGWDLYHWTKDIFSGSDNPSPAVIGQARRNLNTYMKLSVDRPSPLHSCMLTMAWQLASGNHLKLPAFLELWGIENLLPDDYERFTTDDGKTLPALAEKVVQRAAKDAAAAGDTRAMKALMPHLQSMMKRYPDNIWFRQSLVKFLSGLGRPAEAREQAVLFAREKSQEFWAWDLLGDLQENADLRMACYCKGLLCLAEEGFLGRLRLKLARELCARGYATEARGEIETVVTHRQRSGYRIPEEVERLQAEPWYEAATPALPDRRFYGRFAGRAAELLFADLDWIEACAGDSFTLAGEDRKLRRKIYVAGKPHPREVAVPERALGLKGLRPGQPIRIKADLGHSPSDRIKLFTAELRETGAPYDIFTEVVGIVDHVNSAKGVLHVVAGRGLDGVVSASELSARVGDAVALRLATYSSRAGTQTRIVSAAPTQAGVSEAVCRSFRASVRVSNGMGFTDDGIFVPPDLVRAHDMQDDDIVAGRAVITFNKKKQSWGWKALFITGSEEAEGPYARAWTND